MNQTEKALSLAKEIGGENGLNCIAELEPTAAEQAKLSIEVLPSVFRCPDCGFSGRPDRGRACCPICGGERIRMVSGREFYVENLTVE